MKTIAITRKPSPLIEGGERTHVGRDAIDYDRALAQHDGYRAALRELGAIETHLEDADAFPDGVFIEDTALVLPELAILMRPGARSRRPETAGVEKVLSGLGSIERIEGPATIDGGDIVTVGRQIFVGRSSRTSDAGIAALSAITSRHGYIVRAVEMQGCLHLKSGCTALPDGRLIVNGRWIDGATLGSVGIVEVPADEPWGGDVALVGETIVAAAAYPRTIELLEREGYRVRPVEVDEFAKAEGGVTCMSLIFPAPRP